MQKHDRRESFEFLLITVTPAKARVQNVLKSLDTGFRRYDDLDRMRRNSKLSPPYNLTGKIIFTGTNVLAGTSKAGILKAYSEALEKAKHATLAAPVGRQGRGEDLEG